MLRTALILSAGLLAALCFACVAVVPPPPPPAEAQAKPSLTTKAVCSPLAHIKLVSPTFDPTSATGTPTGTDSFPGADVIKSDIIAAAYNTGPSFFLTQLCTLDGIFVTASSDPWGYRNINDGTHYIAIPLRLWTADGVIGLDQYMNRVFGPPLS